MVGGHPGAGGIYGVRGLERIEELPRNGGESDRLNVSKAKVGVIQLPGVNCEYETMEALDRAGVQSVLVRWNAPRSSVSSLQGFVLPGGFSFQDRIRGGAVAAKEAIVELVAQEAAKGKPVLGICNGAQVLVEAGLVPGLEVGRVEMGLAPNKMGDRTGYFCHWVFVKVGDRLGESAFTGLLDPGEVFPIPIAHAEGRFVSSDPFVLQEVERNGQVLFKYCDESGNCGCTFPQNPNGSWLDAAGVCNPDGNVLALMPHPERASWMGQVAWAGAGGWSGSKITAWGDLERMEGPGPGFKIFLSMAEYIAGRGPWEG
jgi:phosphoribosylformylglycinamidine synthase I